MALFRKKPQDRKPAPGLTWNCYVSNGAHDVIEYVQKNCVSLGLVWAVLNEVSPYIDDLKREFGKEYKFYYGNLKGVKNKEDRSTLIMIKRGVRSTLFSFIRTRIMWRGPIKGLRHWGRTFPVVDYWYDGVAHRLVGVHRVPGGPNGHDAEWDAEDRALRQLFNARSSRYKVVTATGDNNCMPENRDPKGTKALARAVHGDLVEAHKVDHMIVRPPYRRRLVNGQRPVRRMKHSTRVLPKGGSDHRGFIGSSKFI